MIALRIVAACLGLLALALPARAAIDIQTVTSPGGITAWLIEDHNIPFTALEIRFAGGTSLDMPGKRGAVNLMTALIEEGAGPYDAQGFAAARDDLAATFRFDSGQDAVSVSSRFLTENRDQAMELLRLALTEPRFDQDAVDRVRGQVLSNLRFDEKDPDAIAGRLFDAHFFGSHPYGTDGSGTIDSVTALTREDMLDAHRGALARDRIFVAAAGDISAADLGLLLDRLLGGLPETGAAPPPRVDPQIAGGVTVQDFPGPQSTILFGHGGIRFDDPDYFAAAILNEILGGGRFSARLMTEVREKRGLTYGISTGLATYDKSEVMIGQLGTANETAAQAIEVIRAEWQRLAESGVTPEELAATKTYLTGSYALRFDGNGPIASILVGMQMIGLPADYPKTRNDRVQAVTLEDVNRVARRLLRPDDLHFIVVGQPAGLQTGP